MHFKYPKVHRFGKAETEGFFETEGPFYIQEKLDGANASVWVEDGEIKIGSRNQEIVAPATFRGLRTWLETTPEGENLSEFVLSHPQYRVFGEWLVKHTIAYNLDDMNRFYVFDIYEGEESVDLYGVHQMCKEYDLLSVPIHVWDDGKHTEYMAKKHLERSSDFGPQREGVVVTNPKFVNKFGNKCRVKFVTETFKETAKREKVQRSANGSEWIVGHYCTPARVLKCVEKLKTVKELDRLEMKHTGAIISMVYNDILTEEIWEIQKKVPIVHFRDLSKQCADKTRQIFHNLHV